MSSRFDDLLSAGRAPSIPVDEIGELTDLIRAGKIPDEVMPRTGDVEKRADGSYVARDGIDMEAVYRYARQHGLLRSSQRKSPEDE